MKCERCRALQAIQELTSDPKPLDPPTRFDCFMSWLLRATIFRGLPL